MAKTATSVYGGQCDNEQSISRHGDSELGEAIKIKNNKRKIVTNNSDGFTINSDGFTIIELLIAFTILAIVSGSLFQMFYISARNNAKAADFDAANGIAITAAELFRANPDLYASAMFASVPGSLMGRTWRSADGGKYIKYYDANWHELEFMFPLAGLDAQAPGDARFVLVADCGERVESEEDTNYVYSPLILNLDATQDYKLVINEDSGGIEAAFNGLSHTIDKSIVGNVISINVVFSQDGVMPKHIAVYNLTKTSVNVNVFGVPGVSGVSGVSGVPSVPGVSGISGVLSVPGVSGESGEGGEGGDSRVSGEGGNSGNSRVSGESGGYIEVSPVTGAVSVMYLDDLALTSVSAMRTISISVRELPSGSSGGGEVGDAVQTSGSGGGEVGGVVQTSGSGGGGIGGAVQTSGSGGGEVGVELVRVETCKYVSG